MYTIIYGDYTLIISPNTAKQRRVSHAKHTQKSTQKTRKNTQLYLPRVRRPPANGKRYLHRNRPTFQQLSVNRTTNQLVLLVTLCITNQY